jgi:two-component system aerobic respiration control protein ArcA
VSRKIDTRDLVSKIERLTRERMSQGEVVDMAGLRRLKDKKETKTLLVIEDDETIRAALKRMFESEGYRVLAAADGTQLSAVLDDAPVDLILLDVGLPWINGFELAEMMRVRMGDAIFMVLFFAVDAVEENMTGMISSGKCAFAPAHFTSLNK